MPASWEAGYSGRAKGTYHNIKRMAPGQFLVRTEIQRIDKIGSIHVPTTSRAAEQVDTTGMIVHGDPPEWLAIGDLVLFGKYQGVELTFDDDPDNIYRILEGHHVYCALEAEEPAPLEVA